MEQGPVYRAGFALYIRCHHMRRLFACAVVAVLSGCGAFAAAALLGAVSAFATPFVADFPTPDPPNSTDYGRGMLIVVVGFFVFAALLIPLWIACFGYLWKKCDADSFIASGITWSARDG